MFLEELDRQKQLGFNPQFQIIRDFARYNIGNLPIFYFERIYGIMLVLKREDETPILFFDRMDYLYSNDKFVEIEFLGHVFGFPTSDFNKDDFLEYAKNSITKKKDLFKGAKNIERLTDIDLFLDIMNN